MAQAQLRSTAQRRGVKESTKHRNQVQLGHKKSEQIPPEKRRRDRSRIPFSSAQAASKAARSRRSCAAQQQRREKAEIELWTQTSSQETGVEFLRRDAIEIPVTYMSERHRELKDHYRLDAELKSPCVERAGMYSKTTVQRQAPTVSRNLSQNRQVWPKLWQI